MNARLEPSELIDRFERGLISGDSFHHGNHVQLAFAYLSVYPPLEALGKFAEALKRYAEARGKSGLYHDSTDSTINFRLSLDNLNDFNKNDFLPCTGVCLGEVSRG